MSWWLNVTVRSRLRSRLADEVVAEAKVPSSEPPYASFVRYAERTACVWRFAMANDRDEVERTTIVETDGGGGGGVLAVVLLIIVVLVLLFLFRDQLGFGSKTEVKVPDQINVNVN